MPAMQVREIEFCFMYIDTFVYKFTEVALLRDCFVRTVGTCLHGVSIIIIGTHYILLDLIFYLSI